MLKTGRSACALALLALAACTGDGPSSPDPDPDGPEPRTFRMGFGPTPPLTTPRNAVGMPFVPRKPLPL